MAVTLSIDRATGVTTFTVVGELTGEKVQESLEAAYSHPDYAPPGRHLVDLRFASISFSLGEFDAILALEGCGGRQGPVKTALVVPQGPIRDVATLFERRAGQAKKQLDRLRVFAPEAEAEQWLAEDAPAREEDSA